MYTISTSLSDMITWETEKKAFWTNKEFVFYFNWEILVKKIGEKNWWKQDSLILMSLLFILWSRNLASKQYNFLNEFRKHEMLMLCIDDHVQCSTQNQAKKVQYPKACTCLTSFWGWFYMSIFKVILSLDCLSLKVTFFQNFDLRSPLSVISTIPGRTDFWCC